MLIPHPPLHIHSPTRSAQIEPRAGRLLTGHEDGSVVLRDGESCAPLRTFGPVGAPILDVGWRSGAVIALDAQARVWWWSADTGAATRRALLRRDGLDGARYEAGLGLIDTTRDEVFSAEPPEPDAPFRIMETLRRHSLREGIGRGVLSWQIQGDYAQDVGRMLRVIVCGDRLITLGLNTYHGEWGEALNTTSHLGVWEVETLALLGSTVVDEGMTDWQTEGLLSGGVTADGEVWCAGLCVDRQEPWRGGGEAFLASWTAPNGFCLRENPREWHALASDASGHIWAAASEVVMGVGFAPGEAIWEAPLPDDEGVLCVDPRGERVVWAGAAQAQSFSLSLG